MKLLMIFALITGIACFSCNPDSLDVAGRKLIADTANYTTIQWLDSIVNFGSIEMGKQTQLRFRFRNTGNKPLFLAHVEAGCGCTIPNFTKGAIAPGDEGW